MPLAGAYTVRRTSEIRTESNTVSEFNIGDVVCIKSGGPHMTVHAVDEHEIGCMRFNNTGECRSHDFPVGVLMQAQYQNDPAYRPSRDEDDIPF
jgi:uncharacterized protein YodC (DUF2158 family)